MSLSQIIHILSFFVSGSSCQVPEQQTQEIFLILFFFSFLKFPKLKLKVFFIYMCPLQLALSVFAQQGVDVEEKPCKTDTAKVFGANTPTVSCHFGRK